MPQNKRLRQSRQRDERRTQTASAEHGGVAHLGEHLPCKQGVRGSIPLISTTVLRTEERMACTLKIE